MQKHRGPYGTQKEQCHAMQDQKVWDFKNKMPSLQKARAVWNNEKTKALHCKNKKHAMMQKARVVQMWCKKQRAPYCKKKQQCDVAQEQKHDIAWPKCLHHKKKQQSDTMQKQKSCVAKERLQCSKKKEWHKCNAKNTELHAAKTESNVPHCKNEKVLLAKTKMLHCKNKKPVPQKKRAAQCYTNNRTPCCKRNSATLQKQRAAQWCKKQSSHCKKQKVLHCKNNNLVLQTERVAQCNTKTPECLSAKRQAQHCKKTSTALQKDRAVQCNTHKNRDPQHKKKKRKNGMMQCNTKHRAPGCKKKECCAAKRKKEAKTKKCRVAKTKSLLQAERAAWHDTKHRALCCKKKEHSTTKQKKEAKNKKCCWVAKTKSLPQNRKSGTMWHKTQSTMLQKERAQHCKTTEQCNAMQKAESFSTKRKKERMVWCNVMWCDTKHRAPWIAFGCYRWIQYLLCHLHHHVPFYLSRDDVFQTN